MTWHIYRGNGTPHNGIRDLPEPPSWRRFHGGPLLSDPDLQIDPMDPAVARGATYQGHDEIEIDAVNAALLLRRPLLVTGKPGTGKSTLAYAVAHELRLGPVLHWPIVSRMTVASGLYQYDAVGRVQDSAMTERSGADPASIGNYLQLGPLGTALLPHRRPRVLLIDEIDKGDLDFPNDLLTVFEEGRFAIPELERIAQSKPNVEVLTADAARMVPVIGGRVQCNAFPFIVLTSNGEREFPPAFLRRCVRLHLGQPSAERLARIVAAHLGRNLADECRPIIDRFLAGNEHGDLATDQLLNAIYVVQWSNGADTTSRERVVELLLRSLNTT